MIVCDQCYQISMWFLHRSICPFPQWFLPDAITIFCLESHRYSPFVYPHSLITGVLVFIYKVYLIWSYHICFKWDDTYYSLNRYLFDQFPTHDLPEIPVCNRYSSPAFFMVMIACDTFLLSLQPHTLRASVLMKSQR